MAQSSHNPSHHYDTSGVTLLLQVPRTNEQKELAAEQMFASLHGLLTMPGREKSLFSKATVNRERISFEIAVLEKRIGFYVWVPNYLKDYVEEQVYAQYPSVQISEVEDYAAGKESQYMTTLATELKMTANDVLPIKTFQSFEVDPLASITAALARFEETEEAWVQMVIRPAASTWHKKSERYISAKKDGVAGPVNVGAVLQALWQPPEPSAGASKPTLSDHEQVQVSGAEEKSQKLAFECAIRIVYCGNVPEPTAKLRMQSILGTYRQFNTTYLNGFDAKKLGVNPGLMAHYHERTFDPKGGFSLNIEETATMYHLPHTNVETPFILWASSQTAEPPANLPVVLPGQYNGDLSPIANTNFRGHNTMFGLNRSDRSRHLYIIGQTGVGKSGLLELLTISDIYSPFGFAVIDPHGDYAQNILRRIPPERAQDVIYFNPADLDFPMAFNPMEVTDPKLRNHTASEIIGVLKRMFESWGPRLEYILRYSLLALLSYPDATMLDITRILTEKKFRNEVLKHVTDPVVRNFWTVEFVSWNDKFAAEAVAPVLNKVGAFVANPLVRNILGQPKSSFNIRTIMDERKILIVNLSRGLVGEDNAALLGALLVTKVQLAAMSRADIPAEQRHPFYLYVDEFQNFATDSFATILSEARKYGLNLTVANQYTAQMAIEVKDAVFGNVGSIIAFRMGADDATAMMRYFEPRFEQYDLVHMHNRHFVVSLTIAGEKVPAFSAISLNLPDYGADQTQRIVEQSRAAYASSRDFVERYVGERYLGLGGQPVAEPDATKKKAPPVKPEAKSKDATVLPPNDPAHLKAQTKPVQPEKKPEAKSPAAALKASPEAVSRLAKAVLGGTLGQIGRVTVPPADTQKPVEKPVEAAKTAPPAQTQPAGDPAAKPKRKRSRRRKRKPAQPTATS